MYVNSALNVSGTVPQLIVSLTLKEVTSQDQGQWRLEVTNDVGTGYVEFQLFLRLADGQDSAKYKYHDTGFTIMYKILCLGQVLLTLRHPARDFCVPFVAYMQSLCGMIVV